MCVNDVICCGAEPLLFLDYIALGKNVPEKVAAIVSGVAEGCVQSGAALVGGETAEMPGIYPENEYDLAGFCVGAISREKVLDKKTMKEGDAVIALPSSGVHSNGFSLIRKIFGLDEMKAEQLMAPVAELDGKGLGEVLLTPTKIYVKPVLEVLKCAKVRSISHITGGGFYENIPRSIPDGLCAEITKSKVKTPPIFRLMQKRGDIDEHDMFNTFNMGVGMEKEGRLFKGCLYFGLMLTKDGPKVVEYNCRFGDPETQVVLPLLKSDLLEIMEAVEKGTLSEMKIEWEEGSACCVIEASEGYPGKYEKGFPISVAEDFRGELYFAGARSADGTEKSGGSAVPKGTLLSNGGRVLGVTAKGATLKEAIDRAYAEVKKVSFQNAYYRKDIGARAMKALNTEK